MLLGFEVVLLQSRTPSVCSGTTQDTFHRQRQITLLARIPRAPRFTTKLCSRKVHPPMLQPSMLGVISCLTQSLPRNPSETAVDRASHSLVCFMRWAPRVGLPDTLRPDKTLGGNKTLLQNTGISDFLHGSFFSAAFFAKCCLEI